MLLVEAAVLVAIQKVQKRSRLWSARFRGTSPEAPFFRFFL